MPPPRITVKINERENSSHLLVPLTQKEPTDARGYQHTMILESRDVASLVK